MTRHRHEKAWGIIAIVVSTTALALTLGCTDQRANEARRDAAGQQDKNTQNTDRQASLGTRSVTGTVKRVVDDGIVVQGREKGESEREWAFVLESDTRLEPVGQLTGAGSFHEGDPVTVVFTNRDGKIVAQSVVRSPAEIPASEPR